MFYIGGLSTSDSSSYSGLDKKWNYTMLEILGGSWAVISGGRSPLRRVTTIVTLLITPHITTHEPPSRVVWSSSCVWRQLAL